MTPTLGDILIEQGKLQHESLGRALRLQAESGRPLGAVLIQLGLVAERDLAGALARQFALPLARAEDYSDRPVLQDRVSAQFLKRARLVPLFESDDQLDVAVADPQDEQALKALRLAIGKPLAVRVGIVSEIESTLRRQFPEETPSVVPQEGDSEAAPASDAELDDIQHLKDLASEAPIIRLVNQTISRALQVRASDIHVEPYERSLKVRYRVDGVLRDVEAPAVRHSAAVISRIKVMANLDIAEQRLPQDGRIRLRLEGRDIDMRVSTAPMLHGESVVMRILDKGELPLEFPALGFSAAVLPQFEDLISRPHGFMLVTGPTGSGKTTTLYAALHRLNTPDRKIITIEDPVEYQLAGVNQMQVRPKIGLGFANTLRSILRQDPDVIMVGEMRDSETAKIAVQAALTGHKVLSTLHTNDAASSLTRLLDMGVEDYLLTSTINGVIAQRLVRTLCRSCREAYDAPPELLRRLTREDTVLPERAMLYRAGGCERCDGSGYTGRTSIFELLLMSEPVRAAVLERNDASVIHQAAVSCGMVTRYRDGMDKVLAGITTVDEVLRAVHAEQA